jgi:serine/threonine protein kinase
MQQQEWEKVKGIFTAALEQPVAMRGHFLAESCGDDEALRGEVESLLAAHEEPKNLLEQHTIDLAAQLQTDGHKYLGKRFGPYSILREIGRGGMGAVFLAERADGEFQQQVALKIIRQSFADRELEKHFRRERQILASLNHPNIAKLLDGGVSDSGELFLAMEFIAGEPLIGFAENHQLTIEERLQLFRKVCRAVSFAHQNLIIHRDLKPSNILVSDEGEPRLLDFGLAKLSESAAAPGGMTNADRTETAFRAFTPAYAAPEQILGKSVTTVSDVFSLGVILYELLTNEKPFHFEGKSLEEIIKTVSGDEPSLPSRTIKSENPQSAIRQRQLRGDLDNITLKALQKDPARRYQSVAEFADDIEKHLEHLPIAARPNTLSYRASRFYQRNRVAVSATALIIVALIAGLGIALRQYGNARRENAKAAAVNDFLQKMLLTAIPESGGSGKKGSQATIVDVLKEAEERLDGEELSSQPEVRAELRQLIGSAYLNQGMYDAAERNLTRAFDEQSSLFGRDSTRTLKVEYSLARLYQEKGDYERAYEIYERRFESWQSEFQQHRIEPRLYVEKLSDFGAACRALGDSKRAEQLVREALDVATRFSLDSQVDFTRTILNLILLDQGRFEEAKTSQVATVARVRQAGIKDNPTLAPALTLMGSILMENGELNDAGANLVEGEGIYRKLYGPEYLAIYDNIRLQAQVAYLNGDFRSGEIKIDLALDNYRKNSSPKNISFATALTIKGLIMNKLGKPAEAESLFREAVRVRSENLPPDHFMTALTKGALGEFLTTQGKYAEAQPLLLSAYENLKQSQSPNSPRIKVDLQRLVTLYEKWGKTEAANEYRKIIGSL